MNQLSDRDRALIDYWSKAAHSSTIRRWRARVYLKRAGWRLTIGFAEGLKRAVDIFGSVAGLLLASPLFALTALLIKIEDGGPIYFKQVRVGKGGKPFLMWKFRSMVLGADQLKDDLRDDDGEETGMRFKMRRDPRITRLGRWLRKFSVDELPQLMNVLKGEMAFVGPRPPIPSEVAQYKATHLRRLRVKPGITCLWQIGGRSDIDFEGQVRLDLQYIRSEGFWQDFKILLLTIPAVIMGRGAY